jgi:hypothetical protein
MDILKMLAELRDEREQVEEAILVLERMASGRGQASWTATEVDDRDEAQRTTTRQQEQAEVATRLLWNHRDASKGSGESSSGFWGD